MSDSDKDAVVTEQAVLPDDGMLAPRPTFETEEPVAPVTLVACERAHDAMKIAVEARNTASEFLFYKKTVAVEHAQAIDLIYQKMQGFETAIAKLNERVTSLLALSRKLDHAFVEINELHARITRLGPAPPIAMDSLPSMKS